MFPMAIVIDGTKNYTSTAVKTGKSENVMAKDHIGVLRVCVCCVYVCTYLWIGIGNTICDIKLFAHAKHNSKQFKSILNVKFVLLQV